MKTKLKCYKYYCGIQYGEICGFVFAESKKDAASMILEKVYYKPDLGDTIEISLVNQNKRHVIDMSWQE